MKKLITTFFKKRQPDIKQQEIELSRLFLGRESSPEIDQARREITTEISNLMSMKHNKELTEKLTHLANLLHELKRKELSENMNCNAFYDFINFLKERLTQIKESESATRSGYTQQALHTTGFGSGLFCMSTLASINEKTNIIDRIFDEFKKIEAQPSRLAASQQIEQNLNFTPQL